MFFLSENFVFDNIPSKSMGVELVTFNSEMFNQIGLTHSESISMEGIHSGMPHYTQPVANDTEDIVLNIILINELNEPKVWDSFTTARIMDWLITDTFKPFTSYDNIEIVYYLKVVKIVKRFTINNTGYLEVTFKPYTHYGYKRLVERTTKGKINIHNPSNLNQSYKPLFEIVPQPDAEKIVITNSTNAPDTPLEIINTGELIIVDNLLRTVQTNTGENRLSKSNRKWIKLNKGGNTINITGAKSVTCICEFPIIV